MWGVILRFVAGFGATKALDFLYQKISHLKIGGSMVNIATEEGGSMAYSTGGGGSSYWGGPIGPAAGTTRKRRRRARLTQSELTELMQIKNLLGKTAAAQILPYYMGRGR